MSDSSQELHLWNMRQTAEDKINKSTNSPVTDDTDDAVGMPPRQWYIGIVPPKHEQKVGEILASEGYETYVASQPRLKVYSSGRKKWVTQVLIHSKIFIKCTDKERHLILKNPEVLRFMTNPSSAKDSGHRALAVIPNREIETLKFMLGQKEYPVSFQDLKLATGDKVKIIRGSLKGLEGFVFSSGNTNEEVIIKLDFLGCAKVNISTSNLELLKTN